VAPIGVILVQAPLFISDSIDVFRNKPRGRETHNLGRLEDGAKSGKSDKDRSHGPVKGSVLKGGKLQGQFLALALMMKVAASTPM
jgi:hypothetical protein